MADEPTPLSHEGAWTEDAYLALDTAGRHIELIDGSLLVGPTPDARHAHAVAVVRAAVAAALPDGLEVTGPVALRLSPDRILVPDLVVAASSPAVAGEVRDSSVALVVIDVVGAGNGVADRWFKPQLYAGSRIPYALLVDYDDPFAVGNMLIGGRYHEYAVAEGDGVLRLEEPFALELDLTALAADPIDPAGAGPAGAPAPGRDGEQSGTPDASAPGGSGPGSGSDDGGSDDGGSPGSGDDVPENRAEPGPGRNGSPTADDGPRRSHPDEDHSVHA